MQAGIRFREQADRYLRILAWMLKDAFRRNRGRILLVITASMCGVLMQGSVLGIVMGYASRLQDNRAINVGPWVLEPRTGLAYGLVGITSLVLLFLSAVLIYMAKWRVAALSVSYEEICSKRALQQIGGRPMNAMPAFGYGSEAILQAMNHEQMANPMLCGRSLGTVLSGAHPLIMTLYMSAFLVYIDARLTALLALLLTAFLAGHYRVNVFVVENEARMRRARPVFRRLLAALAARLMTHSAPASVIERQLDSTYATPEIQELYDRVRHRRMAVARADFLSNIMIAVCMALVIIYLGYQALVGATPWGEVIIYLVALRFTVLGIRNVLNAITSYARFYPGLRAHYELVTSLRVPDAAAATVEIVNRKGFGNIDNVRLAPGDRAAIVSPVALSRYGLFYFTQVLTGQNDEPGRSLSGSADFVSRAALPPETTVSEYLGIDGAMDPAALGEALGDPELVQRVLAAAGRPSATGKPARADMAEICLLAARLRSSGILFLSARVLRVLPPEWVERWLGLFRDRVLFIHYGRNLDAAGRHGEKAVIVGNWTSQCALASAQWIAANEGRVRKRLRGPKRRPPEAAQGDFAVTEL